MRHLRWARGQPPPLPTDTGDSRIEIRRSDRRRTVSARGEDGKVVVLMPAGLTGSKERELVGQMLATLDRSRRRAALAGSDDELASRAGPL